MLRCVYCDHSSTTSASGALEWENGEMIRACCMDKAACQERQTKHRLYLEKGLKDAWDALKWKRVNPLDQIDEARDIIDDTLQRPRINGVQAKLGDPTSRYR